ncbi:hypothetical protein IFM89_022833 [Coptis chinensis]|uniref:Uncharacterized protein n=1 Tax=Coptis chinensis TaxID=261450 RepID=A0A835MIY3_9MAGN|nr:hypothetical protein IFM89_022833 [Coptis chinensis]
MVVITEEMRAKADLCFRDEEGKERSKFLLKDVGLPTGLLPLRDILECGYMEDTGFITAYVDKYKIEIDCVKIKEMLIWVSLSEISIDNPVDGRIAFKGLAGLYRTYPFSAFDNPEVNIQLEYKLPPKIIDNVEEVKEAMVAEEVKEAMVAEEVKEAMVAKEVKDPIVAKEVKEPMAVIKKVEEPIVAKEVINLEKSESVEQWPARETWCFEMLLVVGAPDRSWRIKNRRSWKITYKQQLLTAAGRIGY